MKEKIVIKLGGSSLDNPSTLSELAELVQAYRKQDFEVIIVHGGGPAINKELTAKGITWQFIAGQRQTTPEMMKVINRVLATEVNGAIVRALQAAGVATQGLSGARDKILHCSQQSAELMQVGKVDFVQTLAIENALQKSPGTTLVIAPVGVGLGGAKFNINADWAALRIATAVQAKTLIFLTDQNGILNQRKVLVAKATSKKIQQMIETGVISGGMLVKVQAMMKALEEGVGEVRVLNATLASHLLTNARIGTLLTK